MKKLYKNTLLFLLPVWVIILVLPVNPRLKYVGLKHDCFNHGLWIYDRIYNHAKPIDIAFLGSSHTINGIDDRLIENKLNGRLKVVNFGYCRFGRNLDYVLLKEILKKKNPGYLFLEVRENEDYYSHPVFPYIASDKDVLFPYPFFDRDLLYDIWTHFSYKVELVQDRLFSKESSTPIRTNDFGFASSYDSAEAGLLDKVKLKRQIQGPEPTKLERDFHMAFPLGYLKRIHRLCATRKIKIVFLYLPSYGSPVKKPKEYKTYRKYGKVVIPPEQILQKQSNWHDENHLNQTGAKELSRWLADEIIQQKGLSTHSNHN